MGMFGALQTAGTGLNVFRTWLEATADNVANMQSVDVDTPGGEPFKTKLVIAASNDEGLGADAAHGARVVGIVRKEETERIKFEPDHPLADENGEVKYPGVDMGEQMVNAVAAQRGYQANISVMQYARDAYQAALRLGR